MRLAFYSAIALMLLVAPAPAQESMSQDTTLLVIDAGRLVVMMDQSDEALALLAPRERVEDTAAEAGQSDYAFFELVTAVSRYDLIRDSACRAAVVDPKLCGVPYRPAWMKDASEVRHGNAQLRAMIDDAVAQLEPFWSDICTRGKRLAKDERFCQIE